MAVSAPTGMPSGPQDQRSQIRTFNIAPNWTRAIGGDKIFTFGGFVRQDQFNYYPSDNPFADLTPDLQTLTIGQNRTLDQRRARQLRLSKAFTTSRRRIRTHPPKGRLASSIPLQHVA